MKLLLKILGFLLTLTIIWSCAGDSSDNNTPAKDTSSPTVEVSPEINSGSLFGDVKFVLSFSEEVKGVSANSQTTSCTGTIQIQLSTAGSCLPTTISSSDNIVWTIDPVGELSDGNYKLIIKTGITDLSGNSLGQESLSSFRVEDALSTVVNNLGIALTNSGLNTALVTDIKQGARNATIGVTNDLLTVIPLVFDSAFDVIMAANLNDNIETGTLEVLVESLLFNVAGKSSLILALPEARIAAVPPSFDLLLTNLTTRIATKSGSNSNTLQILTSALVSNLHKTGATAAEIENTYINKIVETAATVVMKVNTDKPTRDKMLTGLNSSVVEGAQRITTVTVNVSTVQASVKTTLENTATKVDASYDLVSVISTVEVKEEPETNSQGCTLLGQAIENNGGIIAYQTSSVSYGQTCSSEIRTCNNGTLSGSFNNLSCVIEEASVCSFNGQSIPHNSSVTGFQTITVPYGENCMDEIRTCNNGILSGSYAFSSCVVEEPSSCSFNGSTLENEASVVAYQTATVASGQTCSSEIRTCSNGTLSGSFQFDTCEPESIQPIIESVFVEDNLYDGTAVSVQVDSQINIRVIASDPKQLPLQYYFRFWECTPPSLTFCSSLNDSFIGYTSEEEVNYYLDKFFIDSYGKLEVKAKNSNGEIETLNIKMIYERDPSILDPSIEEIYVNGEKYIEDSELLTGRNLSINVVANDPKNLDIKYLFWIVNSSTGGVEYTQGYSSDNQVSYTLQDDYTFPNDKVYVRLYIKNTDGVEYFYGWTSGNNVYVDDQATVKLRIEP